MFFEQDESSLAYARKVANFVFAGNSFTNDVGARVGGKEKLGEFVGTSLGDAVGGIERVGELVGVTVGVKLGAELGIRPCKKVYDIYMLLMAGYSP